VDSFNLAVIGAGPGGYPAALLASQKGLRVLLVEKSNLGGVCLNSGCIPTKFLLHESGIYRNIKETGICGIEAESIGFDYRKIKEKKDALVFSLRKGVEYLLKKRGVVVVESEAEIISENTLLLKHNGREETVKADNIIIAAGSHPVELEGLEFNGSDILSSESVLELESLMKSLLVVGGGVVGVEFAEHFTRLGVKVHIVEAMDRILPKEDIGVSKVLEAALRKTGIDIYVSTKVREVKKEEDLLKAILENGVVLNCEKVLVAVSRRPNTHSLWRDLDIDTEGGFVKVNDKMQTSIKNIYAIGDIKGGFMLAHSASYEARVAVGNILGYEILADYGSIPMCIYTSPEIATVGLNEEEAKSKGRSVKTAKFPFTASGKARAISQTDGFVKLVADSEKKVLLGAQLVGPFVTELISEIALAVKFKIPYTELAEVVHPHPTLSEAIQEAIEILNDTPIHFA